MELLCSAAIDSRTTYFCASEVIYDFFYMCNGKDQVTSIVADTNKIVIPECKPVIHSFSIISELSKKNKKSLFIKKSYVIT